MCPPWLKVDGRRRMHCARGLFSRRLLKRRSDANGPRPLGRPRAGLHVGRCQHGRCYRCRRLAINSRTFSVGSRNQGLGSGHPARHRGAGRRRPQMVQGSRPACTRPPEAVDGWLRSLGGPAKAAKVHRDALAGYFDYLASLDGRCPTQLGLPHRLGLPHKTARRRPGSLLQGFGEGSAPGRAPRRAGPSG